MCNSHFSKCSIIYLNQLGDQPLLTDFVAQEIMSKTIRNERTRGWLNRLQRERTERKQARDLKADQSFLEKLIDFDEMKPAM